MIRLKDVARLANVSPATVSRVLSNKGQIRQSTREKVLAAIDQLGYKPSRVARSLRVKSSQIIGLIISDIQNPFFTALVRAVEDVAYENGYAIFLCNSDENIEKESFYIDLMVAENVAGVIVATTRELDSPCKKLLEKQIPVVSTDRRVIDCDVDTVVLDNVYGASELVSYLIELGHTRIGAVLGNSTMTTGRERYEGYLAAHSSHDVTLDPELVRFGIPNSTFGYQLTNELLDLDNPPTAIFAGNNLLAIGVMKAIKSRGLKIPDDIGLVAFDDLEWVTLVQPPLTVIAQPTYKMGQLSAQMILQRIADSTRPYETVILQPTVKFRESVNRILRREDF